MKSMLTKSFRKEANPGKGSRQKHKMVSNKTVAADNGRAEEEYIYDEYEGAYVKKRAIGSDTLDREDDEIIF
jgi:hypothetical protein